MYKIIFILTIVSAILLLDNDVKNLLKKKIKILTEKNAPSHHTTESTFCQKNPQMLKILTPPKKWPINVVFDTDLDNEIDDKFALSWALRHPEKFTVKGVYAAPFSFQPDCERLLRAYFLIQNPSIPRNATDKALVAQYAGRIKKIQALGVDPASFANDTHVCRGPASGMNKSYTAIFELFQVLDLPTDGLVYPGASDWMSNPNIPVESQAVNHLIQVAKNSTPKNPLYIIAIGAPTNTASALVKAPEIRDRVVVIWDASYPTTTTQLEEKSLNLAEDIIASRLLFTLDFPLVYVPGYYIAQQLSMSLPDIETWSGGGKLGKYLLKQYKENPLNPFFGNDINAPGYHWIQWDVANIAWIFNPSFLGSWVHRGPILGNDNYWKPNEGNKCIREADNISTGPLWASFWKTIQ